MTTNGCRTLKSCPTEIEQTMSNCDHAIDDGMADALKSEACHSHHYGWEFCGIVWWDGHEFVERVGRFNVPIDTLQADTLEELMQVVNDKWGWE